MWCRDNAVKKLFLVTTLALALFCGIPAYAQRTSPTGIISSSILNPLSGNLSVQDAGTCSTAGSFLWQQLPNNPYTTTVNLAGTFSGTLTVRESNNNGSVWTTAGTITSAGTTSYQTSGYTDFCVDLTTFTSGVFQVSITTGSVIGGSGVGTLQPSTSSNGLPVTLVQAPAYPVTITNISNDGANFYVTCTTTNCAPVPSGISVNLNNNLPGACADAVGNTSFGAGGHAGQLVITNTGACTFSGSQSNGITPYPAQALVFQNAAGDANHLAQITQTADGHIVVRELISGSESVALDMQNSGLFALRSDTYATGFSVSTAQEACVGGNQASFEGATCPGFGIGYGGLATRYDGQAIQGLSVPVYKASGNTTGNYSNATFYTAPASGLGGNSMYHLKGVLTETGTAASATAYVTITYTPRVGGPFTVSSCSVDATNINCMGTTAVATVMATIGNSVPFDITFELGNSQTVSISVTTANSPVYDYFYQLYLDNN